MLINTKTIFCTLLLQFLISNHSFAAENWQRTVIFVYGETRVGEDMFIRGGIDHSYAKAQLGKSCTSSNMECAIPIRYLNTKNSTTQGWKKNDNFLDWYGKESQQSSVAEGSVLDWTTNNSSNQHDYESYGFGYSDLNKFGDHYWIFDVEMDCSQTANNWFEFKSFIKNGAGWESDVQQNTTPWKSGNHFAQCGKLNVFQRNQNQPVLISDLTDKPKECDENTSDLLEKAYALSFKDCRQCHREHNRIGTTLTLSDPIGEMPDVLADNLKLLKSLNESSLNKIIEKPTSNQQHNGGKHFDKDSYEYNLLKALISTLKDNPSCLTQYKPLPLLDNPISDAELLNKASLLLRNKSVSQDEIKSGSIDEVIKGFIENDRQGFEHFIFEQAESKLKIEQFLNIGSQGISVINDPYITLTGKYTNIAQIWQRIGSLFDEDNRKEEIWRSRLWQMSFALDSIKLIQNVAVSDLSYDKVFTGIDDEMPISNYQEYVTNGSFGNCSTPDCLPDQLSWKLQKDPYGRRGIMNSHAWATLVFSTESNKNRKRTNWAYKHLWGFDIEEFAIMVDPNLQATMADNSQPNTTQGCMGCHILMDNHAQYFANLNNNGITPKHLNEGTKSAYNVGQFYTQDPRFAYGTVKFWFPAIFGREPFPAPMPKNETADVGLEDLTFQAQWNSYRLEQFYIAKWAGSFQQHYSLKSLIIEMLTSDYFRAQNNADITADGLAYDLGTTYKLSPKQLTHKIFNDFRVDAWILEIRDELLPNIYTYEYPQSDFRKYRLTYGGSDGAQVKNKNNHFTTFNNFAIQAVAQNTACQIIDSLSRNISSSDATQHQVKIRQLLNSPFSQQNAEKLLTLTTGDIPLFEMHKNDMITHVLQQDNNQLGCSYESVEPLSYTPLKYPKNIYSKTLTKQTKELAKQQEIKWYLFLQLLLTSPEYLYL